MSSEDRSIDLKNGLTFEYQELVYAEKLDIRFGFHIGSGAFSHVYKARYRSKSVALKICENTDKLKHFVFQEMIVFDILRERPHKNIIRFLEKYDSFDSKRKWVVMEWLDCVDLGVKLMHMDSPFEECLAKCYFKQIVEGLKFLHSLAIVHRDIKLDNILVGFDPNDSSIDGQKKECIKIIDFGFAKKVQLKDSDGTARCKSQCGTSVYMAPEILDYENQSDYDAFKSDIFSLAVLLYVMLFYEFPDRDGQIPTLSTITSTNIESNLKTILSEELTKTFDSQLLANKQIINKTEQKITLKVKPKPFEYPDEYNHKVSDSAKQLILDMSCEDSVKRFNINQILDSEWMQSSD